MKKMLLALALWLSIPFSFYAALVPIDHTELPINRTESAISAFVELSNPSTTPTPDSNKSSSVSADLLSSDWETIGNPEVRLIKIKHLIKESLNTFKNPLVDEYALQTVLESWSFFTLLSTSDLSVETLVEASLNDTKYSLQDLKKIHYSLGFENTGPITPQQINSKFKEMKDAFMLLKNNQVATAEEKKQAIDLLKERALVLYPFMTEKVKLSLSDSLGINQLLEPSKEEIKKVYQRDRTCLSSCQELLSFSSRRNIP